MRDGTTGVAPIASAAERKATASQALTHHGGHYLCVRDREEAAVVCAFIRGLIGADEIRLTREALGWVHEPFVVPEQAYDAWDGRAAGLAAESRWVDAFDAYGQAFPERALELVRRMNGELPRGWAQAACITSAHTGNGMP